MRYRFRRRRRPRFPLRTVALVLAAVLLLSWLFGLLGFVAAIPRTASESDRVTDAVVVLTGGSKRIGAGLRELRAGRAGLLFLSGVDPALTPAALRKRVAAAAPSVPDRLLTCCLAIGYDAADTVGNADETASWMREGGHRSLRLVTSNYHMPRARLEFAAAMPAVEILAVPVFADSVRIERWWRYPGTLWLVVREYNKLLLARLRLAIRGVIDRAVA